MYAFTSLKDIMIFFFLGKRAKENNLDETLMNVYDHSLNNVDVLLIYIWFIDLSYY